MVFLLTEAQSKIGYEFKNVDILRQCFTHPSYTNEHKQEKDYERLEFLGDSVLGFIVADYLFKTKSESEGDMTEDKKNTVSKYPLSKATEKLGIANFLLTGGNFQMTDSVRENLFEAIVGGIYLDGGIAPAKNFVYKNLLSEKFAEKPIVKDFKSLLNEYSSKRKLGIPHYKTVGKTGKDNAPVFKIQLELNGEIIAESTGASKKIAEQKCAEQALEKLKNKKRR